MVRATAACDYGSVLSKNIWNLGAYSFNCCFLIVWLGCLQDASVVKNIVVLSVLDLFDQLHQLGLVLQECLVDAVLCATACLHVSKIVGTAVEIHAPGTASLTWLSCCNLDASAGTQLAATISKAWPLRGPT